MKKIIKDLREIAWRRGIEMQSAFLGMLDFFIRTFDPELITRCGGRMDEVFRLRMEEDEAMAALMERWIRTAEEAAKAGEVMDCFGGLYEEIFLGKSKAGALGQFFTPMPLCEAMSELVSGPSDRTVAEPSCGSGRNVLSYWKAAGRSRLIVFRCQDLDPASVKMCALNMMINGMYGSVICGDSLDPDSFHFGYAVNEIRYPMPSPYYSLREMKHAADFRPK